MFSRYSLTKCRRILRHACTLYKKKGPYLTETDRKAFANDLESLDIALVRKDRKESDLFAKKVEIFLKSTFPKTFFDHARELFFALLFAVVFAFLIRQFWFELYEVPTGSMRPTIEELDRLVVSKTTFGINLPFRNDLIFHKPEYIKRLGTIVFTVKGMDVADADTRYFYLFPGKKRFVKRCLGKPGDTLYFYGGLVYGIDKDGNSITELADETYLKSLHLEKIDHIPYITLDGKVEFSDPLAKSVFGKAILKQMNLPVAKIAAKRDGTFTGSFFNGTEWTEENIAALKKPHSTPQSYSDLWGIGNYAMARLLTKDQVLLFYGALPEGEQSPLYLEMRHTPNVTFPKPELRRGESGRGHPTITPFASLIPLQEKHVKALQDTLYTARFCVRNGHAFRYQEGRKRPQPPAFDPLFPHVPNGCYEFYYGVGYKVLWFGIRKALPSNHPLYTFSPEMVQKLFNVGMAANTLFEPVDPNQTFNPQRFAYFREGALYVMGAPIFEKNDPVLIDYVAREERKQESSSNEEPYIAFVDHGAPSSLEFIKAFGLKIPEGYVLALGDNHAMSADSRDFGFVPVHNLRGSPAFTFWPPSRRVGALPQPSYPWFTLPNVVIWTLVILVFVGCYTYAHKRNKKRRFKP